MRPLCTVQPITQLLVHAIAITYIAEVNGPLRYEHTERQAACQASSINRQGKPQEECQTTNVSLW